jgi:flagellar hook-associated protein 3 FlgL
MMLNPISNRAMIDINRQQNLSRAITETQIQISTGHRLQRASDDPVAAQRIATLGRAQSDNRIWAINLDRSISTNAQAETAVRSLADTLASARELVVAGANGATSSADRSLIADQLDGLATHVEQMASQKLPSGQPLFVAGAASPVRYREDVSFAPVPARDDIFSVNGVSISQGLRDAAMALRSGASADASLDVLDSAINATSDMLGVIGQTAQQLDDLRKGIAEADINFASERSGLEDTDLSEALARLNTQTLTLEAAQSVFARINRQSLFDLIS